jgi:hypothetical protein
MKVYVAMRFDRRDEARRLMDELERLGHSITRDWTTHKSIGRKGSDPELSRTYATEDLDGVLAADAMIMIPEPIPAGTGMHTELGAAICKQLESGRPRIFVAGEGNGGSLMYFHPAVERRATVEDVLAELAV